VFIDALVQIINAKCIYKNTFKNIVFLDDFEINIEKGTDKQKRIDILIKNDNTAIIIENKIFHTNNNPLDIYYNTSSLSKIKDDNKIGVLLTLWPQDPKNPNFINITHNEWLNEISKNITKNNKYNTFFEDFKININNISFKMELKDIEFFTNHKSYIHKAINLKSSLRKHIINQVEASCSLILDNELIISNKTTSENNKKRLRYFIFKNKPSLCMTVVFENILNNTDKNGEFYIVVEVRGESNIKKIRGVYDDINKVVNGKYI
jgi:hypothetical protein